VKVSRLHCRLILLAFVAALLSTQLMGLHYHRHAQHHASADAGSSVHLRDFGVHVEGVADGIDHHSLDDRASHPGDDLEVEPVADSVVKFYKTWLATGFVFLAVLWSFGPAPAAAAWVLGAAPRPHRSRFVLRPPSNAPPLKLSTAR
jgi:hypothetical protein